jgi:hypothetical protein
MEQTETLESFFSEKLGQALKDQHVEVDTRTEYYLVQLLAAYGAQPLDDSPLGLKLLTALGAAPPERRRQLREVGDTSLFVSGFWSDSFARRPVDVDYYIGLGGSAYGELARTGEGWTRDPFGMVYQELARNFARFVSVLAVLSRACTQTRTAHDVLRLYEKYRRGGSRWAAARLAELGVMLPGLQERPQ